MGLLPVTVVGTPCPRLPLAGHQSACECSVGQIRVGLVTVAVAPHADVWQCSTMCMSVNKWQGSGSALWACLLSLW